MTTLSPAGAKSQPGSTSKKSFGKTPGGQPVDLFVLTNKNGAEVSITNYGGAVVSIKLPDRSGKFADVVLGYDTIDGYVNDKGYFGVLVGRYGNRIAHAQFVLDGKTYTLAKNNGENSLHGGVKGFNKAVWTAKTLSKKDGQSLELSYLSQDGEEGFPGNLKVTVIYTLTDSNALKIEYSATTDKKTVVNLTNHSYFNLAGQGNGDILGHLLTIEADKFTPVDSGLIPTGEHRDVAGTPFDFRKPTAVGARIDQDAVQPAPANPLPRALSSPLRAASSRSGPRNRVCSFTPAIFWMGKRRARAALPIRSAPRSVWKRSTFLIRRTSRNFHRSS